MMLAAAATSVLVQVLEGVFRSRMSGLLGTVAAGIFLPGAPHQRERKIGAVPKPIGGHAARATALGEGRESEWRRSRGMG